MYDSTLDDHCRCACSRNSTPEASLKPGAFTEQSGEKVPRDRWPDSTTSPSIQEILSLRSREAESADDARFPRGGPVAPSPRLTMWVKTHVRSLAFAGGLAAVLICVALFSLATSGVRSSPASADAPPTTAEPSMSTSANPAPSASAEAVGDVAVEPEEFLRSVLSGTVADPSGSALKTQLGCETACGIGVRAISATGDVSISVVSSIDASGLVRARRVIVESGTAGMRIRQIIQPATASATG